MAKADIDKNGDINYSEWIMASSNLKTLVTEEKLETAFQFFDKDNNGWISISELKDVLGMKTSIIGDEVWSELVGEINKDGQISKNEFRLMMKKLVDGTI